MSRSIKSFFGILILVSLLFSCSTEAGKEGKAYLTVEAASNLDAVYCGSADFPSSWSFDTSFAIDKGDVVIQYAAAIQEYDSVDSRWELYINSWDGYLYYNNSTQMNAVNQLNYYLYEETTEGGQVFRFTISIEVNEGEEGTLFADGEDGADMDYTLILTYDPDDLTLSGKDKALAKTVLDDGLMQFKDAYRTFTIDYDMVDADPDFAVTDVN